VKTVILTGPSGAGKTSFAEYFAKQVKAEVFYLLCHEWTTNEDLFHRVDIGKAVMNNPNPYQDGVLSKAIKASVHGNSVIIIDELDKAREKVDTLLLDFAQNCRVNDHDDQFVKGNPSRIWLFITSNDKRQLSDPLMRRCFRYRMDYLPEEVETALVCGADGYHLDAHRMFLLRWLKSGFPREKKRGAAEADKLGRLIHKVSRRLRQAKLDVSLYEMRNLYRTLKLAQDPAEVEMSLSGWLVRSPEHEIALSKTHRSMANLSNTFWSVMHNDHSEGGQG
jgi:hypothetical protein